MQLLYCIACPAGCEMEVMGTGALVSVNGNKCSKGKDFALAETTNPKRVLTTTVRTNFPDIPVIPVRTNGEIPKGMLRRAVHELSTIIVKDELACGDVVVDNLLGSGVSVIITSGLLKQVGAELENKNEKLSGDITATPPDDSTTLTSDSDIIITAMPGVMGSDDESGDGEAEDHDGSDDENTDEEEDWRHGRAQIRR